jgi:predicted PhzF superfamily epimerase YddE/YHI9
MINPKTIYQVDAFTDVPFKGNPAGVMFVDEFTEGDWMQKIALEMNLSETAFIIAQGDTFGIRYFTPLREVPICGHATLASAHIIYELGILDVSKPIHFRAKEADLIITKAADWIMMKFPKYPLTRIKVPDHFREVIGFDPIETYSSSYGWIIAIASTEDEISTVKPLFDKMSRSGLGHLMITAKSQAPEVDFVVRCFAPISGINEDPVTGSAHCALTPLWAEKLGKNEMSSFQLSYRIGHLKVRLIDDSVEICGKAVTVFEADLKV